MTKLNKLSNRYKIIMLSNLFTTSFRASMSGMVTTLPDRHRQTIEMVQRRSARFVLNKKDRYASVTKMMESLGWPSLQSRRTNAKLIMFYKIINNIVDVDIDVTIIILVPVKCPRGHLMQLYTRVDTYKYS